jgi:hypothetical protein
MIFKSGYKIKLQRKLVSMAATTTITTIRESSLYELTQRIIQTVCLVKHTTVRPTSHYLSTQNTVTTDTQCS